MKWLNNLPNWTFQNSIEELLRPPGLSVATHANLTRSLTTLQIAINSCNTIIYFKELIIVNTKIQPNIYKITSIFLLGTFYSKIDLESHEWLFNCENSASRFNITSMDLCIWNESVILLVLYVLMFSTSPALNFTLVVVTHSESCGLINVFFRK